MVKIEWKLERGRVYLKVITAGNLYFYWFPKRGRHKRFHPRSIFTRQINHSSYKDPLIPKHVITGSWIEWKEGELEDRIVKEKLGIQILTEEKLYEQLSKAC